MLQNDYRYDQGWVEDLRQEALAERYYQNLLADPGQITEDFYGQGDERPFEDALAAMIRAARSPAARQNGELVQHAMHVYAILEQHASLMANRMAAKEMEGAS